MGTDIGREMALPMETIIGGPLQALVKAQAMAASETADFIQSVGLKKVDGQDFGEARTVGFSFERQKLGENNEPVTEEVKLNVPLLTIVPMPFIRIEEASIDFECNVSSSSVETKKIDAGVNTDASTGFWGTKLSVKASYSQKKESKSQVDKSASLKVNVKAVQSEMPGGLAKVLQIMETAVTETAEPK